MDQLQEEELIAFNFSLTKDNGVLFSYCLKEKEKIKFLKLLNQINQSNENKKFATTVTIAQLLLKTK
jgi:hypothetical protein